MISLYDTTEYTGFARDIAAKRPKKTKVVLLAVVFIVPVVLGMGIYYISGFYTDFTNDCRIRIRSEAHNGNITAVKSVLNELRVTDKSSYLSICRKVYATHETACVLSEENNPKVTFLNDTGCYLKGTGLVFLKPLNNKDTSDIEIRVEFLRKLTDSNDF